VDLESYLISKRKGGREGGREKEGRRECGCKALAGYF
jgi:hypothetical protein